MKIEAQEHGNGTCTVILKNSHLEVWISSKGATILKLLVKDKDGQWQDVVLGYADLEDYETYQGYLGAVVGRTANRIAEGKFSLNGEDHQLPVNNGPNCNHGGNGFSFRNFSTVIGKEDVLFYLVSPDGDQGYPGNLTLTVRYKLHHDKLEIFYQAMSDQDTLCNLTNHSYFNLDGKPTPISGHTLAVKANLYGPVDEDGLVTGELRSVKDTPFDFRTEKRIGDALTSHHPQIRTAKGLDHPFVFSADKDQVCLYSPETGIEMTVSTNMPLAQIYSANYLGGEPGKDGTVLERQSGICFETQYMADDINLHPATSQTILKKGEVWDGCTSFQFKVRDHAGK